MAAGDLVLTDRGYCSLLGFLRVQSAGADFLCRVPRGCLAAADALFAANQAGVSVTVELASTKVQRRALRRAGLPLAGTRVRLVSVRLSTGELEVLATSLLDEALYPAEVFGEAYALRWGIETYYGRLKGRLGLENFT
jgi:Transposase DDE domain